MRLVVSSGKRDSVTRKRGRSKCNCEISKSLRVINQERKRVSLSTTSLCRQTSSRCNLKRAMRKSRNRSARKRSPRHPTDEIPRHSGGSLLPEHLLPESLEGSAAPVFLEEPKDAFVIRNRPARLYCKAAHALKVYFQCSGSWGKDKHEESGLVDPMTGIRQTESHLDVPRNALDQYFGKEPFSCRCTAWSSTGEVVSRKATITDASRDFSTSAPTEKQLSN
ncbi:unnamed protein product [Notodromas monacha]|uniref:Ig-like domain-containing protein n=1 Tax=Notodromas monacha TaxID=399045 RepID=A0A7R9G8F0_9CRUS|nr:unnamed protein product [Notodromas monacha]CAG0913213.1 unnamed protein product [Notodromas monacha]